MTAGLKLHARQAVVDGELVAVDASGRPSFQALQHRSAHPQHVIAYYAFDLLHLDGRDLTSQTLDARRALLVPLLQASGVLLSEILNGTAAQVTAAVRGFGLEGVIAKRRDSRYVSGERTAAWVKVKLDHQ